MSQGQNYTGINLRENTGSDDGDEPPPDIHSSSYNDIFRSLDLLVEEESLYLDPPGTFSIDLGLVGFQPISMEQYRYNLESSSGYH